MRVPLILAALLLVAAGPSPRTASPHTASPPSTPVPLTAQPGTPLDAAARKLVMQDLSESRRAGETPLILVGSASLGAASDRPALFVQLQSARECGSAGCSTTVYLWQKGTWKQVLDSVGSHLAVSAGKTRGMADLLTDKERYIWTGQQYADVHPAPQVDLRPRPGRR